MKDSPPQKRPRRKPAWGKIIAGVVVLAALALLWRYTPVSEYITAERISGWARAVREYSWAPVIIMLLYTPACFVMFPRPLLTLATVIAFGPWLGFAYGMAGILLAALATYYAGRFLKPTTVEKIGGDKAELMRHKLKEHGLLAVFAIRIVPVAPFAVEGIIAGASRVKLWQYTLGTFLGMFPGVFVTSVYGDQISAALEDASNINWWLVAIVALVFVVMTWYVGRWFARK